MLLESFYDHIFRYVFYFGNILFFICVQSVITALPVGIQEIVFVDFQNEGANWDVIEH